jgi:alkyldihydroxyacetonephosphate synthase
MLDFDAIRGGTADAIEVAAPWDCIADVWREMRKALEPFCTVVDCHFSHVYHTGASVYVIFHSETGGDDREGEERYLKCLDIAIRTSLKYGGNVSHHHGSGKAKAAYLALEHGEAGMAVMHKIKDALDPKGLLNKGVLGL